MLMNLFRAPMIGFSVLPAIPVLWLGAVIALEGFWHAVLGDQQQLLQLLIWLLGVCGAIGLIMASLEKTYASRTRRVTTICLLACGLLAFMLCVYHVSASLAYQGHIEHAHSATTRADDAAFYAYIVLCGWLLWPLFSAIQGIKKCFYYTVV